MKTFCKTLLLLSYAIINCQLFIINSANAQAPNWAWAKGMGGTGNDYGNSIAVDNTGNVYTTGTFTTTVDFDPGTGIFNLTPAFTTAIFISKLNTAGNFDWAKAIDGSGNKYVNSITEDGAGNLYITGSFTGTTDFDPGTGILV